MRVLLTSFPTASHYFPMVPLAWALSAAGHEVRVACSPSLVEAVRGSGMVAVPVGAALDNSVFWRGSQNAAGQPPGGESHRDRAMAMFGATAAEMLPDLLEFAAAWRPQAIVHEPRGYAGPVAASVLGVPSVGHLWGIDRTEERWPDDRRALEPVLERYGVARIDPLGELTIDPCPPVLQSPGARSRFGIRYVPYNGPGTQPPEASGSPSPPRICVTWGTTYRWSAGPHPVQQVLDALAACPLDVVAAVPPRMRGELDAPEGVRVVESRPLHLLLRGCSGIVHHAGLGTLMTAAVGGVPQLVVPSVTDGEHSAACVDAAKAGIALERDALADPHAVSEAVWRLVEDTALIRGARHVAEQAALQPPPSEAVRVLEAVVAGRG
ncbi:nucleotide disphospho-sugar-binding domain-containing protein [Streptomonospora algeriensis]|uniref:Nucleotide disphospho-sugar-binding domain-containing protein n=1 Tax=Streptomonospora algeriensis TaxID=995084 RepID=A0ABW3BAM4_9ACTN